MFEVQWPKMKLMDPDTMQDELPSRRFDSQDTCSFCALVWAIIRDKGIKFDVETRCRLGVLWGELDQRFESQVLAIQPSMDTPPSIHVDFAFLGAGWSIVPYEQ